MCPYCQKKDCVFIKTQEPSDCKAFEAIVKKQDFLNQETLTDLDRQTILELLRTEENKIKKLIP